ncbi:MAG: hypothetical protein ABI680_10450, partial [Chthoniobacteraceae bacterium]
MERDRLAAGPARGVSAEALIKPGSNVANLSTNVTPARNHRSSPPQPYAPPKRMLPRPVLFQKKEFNIMNNNNSIFCELPEEL